MKWYWATYVNKRDTWTLFLDDDGVPDSMAHVKKIKAPIPYKAWVEGEKHVMYFDYLTDAKRWVESYFDIRLTKKRKNSR